MTTPEGRVKKNIRRVLDSFGVYYLMPVQMGMGAAGVDFHCVVRVTLDAINGKAIDFPLAFFIEAKKPGEKPTDRQRKFIKDRATQQNCLTFVIDDDPSIGHNSGGLDALTVWLESIEAGNERVRTRFAPADV